MGGLNELKKKKQAEAQAKVDAENKAKYGTSNDPEIKAYRSALAKWDSGGQKTARPEPPPQAAPELRYTAKELKAKSAYQRDIEAGRRSGDTVPVAANGQEGSGALLAMGMANSGLDINNPDDVQTFQDQWNNAAAANPTNGNPEDVYAEYDPAKRAENARLSQKSKVESASMNWATSDDYVKSRAGVNDPWLQAQNNATLQANAAQGLAAQQNTGLANQGVTNANSYQQQLAALGQQSTNYSNAYNAQDQALLGQYSNTLQGVNNFDANNYGQLQNALGQTRQLSAGGYGADVASQAALARANPEDVARQNASYNALGGFANGSYNLTSAAAQAYADPNAISAQYSSLGQMQGAANGSLNGVSQGAQAYADPWADQQFRSGIQQLGGAANGSLNTVSQAGQAYADPLADQQFRSGIQQLGNSANGALNTTSVAAQAYADAGTDAKYRAGLGDLYGVANGSKDVGVGEMDPEAYAAQVDARNKYKDLTDPRVTAQERLIYEQARTQQEQDERGNRAAILTNMRQAGRGGGAAELASAAIGGQQTSRNRLLSDLGAQANAIDRSQQALAGYANQSNVMGDQANQLGTANANRQLSALSQYANEYGQLRSNTFNEAYQRGAATDTTNMSNANRQLQAQGMYTDQAGNLRQQTFNEAFQRGSAVDQTNQANSNRQLQAMGLYTDQAGNLRAQTFDEAYKRGTSADQMQMANANRQLQAMGMSFDAAGNIREQSFNEAYQRGAATDSTNQFNVNTQFAGTQAQGAMATDMRNQGFAENFQTASAGDAMAQFNKEQSQVTQRWQEQYAAGQQTDAWNRQLDTTNQGNVYSSNVSNRAGQYANTSLSATQNASQRSQQAIDANATYGTQGYAAQTQAMNTLMGANTASGAVAQQQLQNSTAYNGLQMDNNRYNTGMQIDSNNKKATANSVDQGIMLANNESTGTALWLKEHPLKYDNEFDAWQNGGDINDRV